MAQDDQPTPPDDTTSKDDGFDFTDPNSPLAPFYLQTSHVLAAVFILGIFLFFGLFPPLMPTDFWGHLKFGQWIVEHGQLPVHEPFSPYSDSSVPYFHFQWLTQIIFYYVFQAGAFLAKGDELQRLAGGVDMVRGFHGLVVALRCLFLLLAFWRLGKSLPTAWAGLGIVLFFSNAPSAVQRPQAMGELCFAILLYLLSNPKLSFKAMIAIPVLFVAWANLHGSFLIGLPIPAIFALGRAIEMVRATGWKAMLRDTQIYRLLAVCVVSIVAAAFINPQGPELFVNAFKLAHNLNVSTMDEWSPLDFSKPTGGHWGYLAMIMILFLSQAISPASMTPTQLLLLLNFGLVPLFHQRMMTWWVMVFGYILVPLWKAAWDQFAPTAWKQMNSVPSFKKTLFVLALSVVCVIWSYPCQLLMGKAPSAQSLTKSLAPTTPLAIALQLNGMKIPELTRHLEANYPDGKLTGNIYASETISDFFLYAAPDYPPFVYSHVHVFPPEHWKDHMTVLFAKAGWWDILDRNDINLVVIESEVHKELADKLRKSPAWQIMVDEDETSKKADPRTRLLFALRKKVTR